MGNIASINFKPVKANSTRHNERIGELDYVYSDLSQDNESWKVDEIQNRYKSIAELTKEKTGRKIQAKATPIREAVVNLSAHHTMQDVKDLAEMLEESYGIKAFQIHIHRDEGKSRDDLNYHAHILWDWQDKETGKSFKLNRKDVSLIQDLTATSLGMQRGDLKENSNRERLEAVEYKRQQEQLKLSALQEEVQVLEQKKNEAERSYYVLSRQDPRAEGFLKELAKDRAEENAGFQKISMEQLEEAVRLQRGHIEREDEEQQHFAKELDEADRGAELIATLKSRIREAKLQLEEAPNEIKEQDRLLEEAEREYNDLKERIKGFKDV